MSKTKQQKNIRIIWNEDPFGISFNRQLDMVECNATYEIAHEKKEKKTTISMIQTKRIDKIFII